MKLFNDNYLRLIDSSSDQIDILRQLFPDIFSKLEEEAMSELPDNTVTAALTFKVPQKVGWSVQNNDQSWTGTELASLVDCLAEETHNQSITLSLSLIFELTANGEAVRS